MWIYEVATLKFLQVNTVAITHYGYSKKEFLGMTLLDIRPDSETSRLLKLQKSPAVDSLVHKGVWKHKKKNGEIIDVQITAHRLELNGKIVKLVLADDITEKLKAEEKLIRSNERYHYASRATFDAIWDWDLITNQIYWGEGYKNGNEE